MALPEPLWAVYHGTIRLKNGEFATYTAAEVATLYGVQDEEYIEIALTDPEPFENGQDYMRYYHLKPLSDGQYFNAIDRYNTETPNESYLDEDFDARRGGKWAARPEYDPYADD